MTHTFLQLTNKLFVSQIILTLAAIYLAAGSTSFSVWHWIIGLVGAYILSAIQAGIVRLLTTNQN